MIQLSSSRVGWSCHVKREGITIIVRFTCNDIKQVFSEGKQKKKNNVNYTNIVSLLIASLEDHNLVSTSIGIKVVQAKLLRYLPKDFMTNR